MFTHLKLKYYVLDRVTGYLSHVRAEGMHRENGMLATLLT